MLVFALLPLVCYFAFLTRLYFRQTPTVLNGSLDFTLLAWGLFGLMTLGPGRLLIPLYVFATWEIYTWIFWFGFYFTVIHFLSLQFRNRFVIYHCQRELVLPAFFALAQQIDPKTEWSGNVLSLHGLGLQWSVIGNKWSGCIQFIPTNPYQKNPHREMLQGQLTDLCRTLVMSKTRVRWFWATLTFVLLCVVIVLLFRDFSILVQQFSDHWLSV